MKLNLRKRGACFIAAVMCCNFLLHLPTGALAMKASADDAETSTEQISDLTTAGWQAFDSNTGEVTMTQENGVYNVTVVNPGGRDMGGEDRWDCQFLSPNLTLTYGHTYRIAYAMKSDQAGYFYTLIGDTADINAEYWHSNGTVLSLDLSGNVLSDDMLVDTLLDAPSSDTKVEYWKWEGNNIDANAWTTYAYEFVLKESDINTTTPPTPDGTAFWSFHIGGNGQFTPDGCFPAGTNLQFKNLVLVDVTEGSGNITSTGVDEEIPVDPETTEATEEIPTETEIEEVTTEPTTVYEFSSEERSQAFKNADVDQNKSVNMSDILAIMKYVCGSTILPTSGEAVEGISYGDINLDGTVNIADIVLLNQMLMGESDPVPMQTDPNGTPELILSAENTTVQAGETAELFINVDSFTGESIYGYELDFEIDPAVSVYGCSSYVGSTFIPNNDTIQMAICDYIELPTEGSIVSITVHIPEDAQDGEVYTLKLSKGIACYDNKTFYLCDIAFDDIYIVVDNPEETTTESTTTEATTTEATTTETTTTETTTTETTTTETTTTETTTTETTTIETTTTEETTIETTIDITYEEDDESFHAVVSIPENNEAQELQIITNELSAVFDENAVQELRNQSGDNNITLSYQVLTDAPSDTQQEAIEEILTDGGKLFELTLTDENGEAVPFSNEEAGGSVTITIPYTLTNPESAVHVYYIAPDGTKTNMNGTYDAESETVTFTTTHFSLYVIAEEENIESLPQTGANTWLQTMILWGAVMLTCGGFWVISISGIIRRKTK